MSRRLTSAALAASIALVAAPVEAQIGCQRVESQGEEARALFVAGLEAVRAGRWADAVDRLDRAYEISCQYAALYNLGIAQRALGRHRAARDSFALLLAEHPDAPEEMRANAQTYQGEEAARVATLELLGLDADVRPELSFDGRPVRDDGSRPIRIETDAGSHSLVARLEGHQPFLWDGTLADGQNQSVTIDLVALATGEGFDPTGLLIAIAAGLLVAGGVVAGIVIYEETRLRPLYPDSTVRVGSR